MATYVEYWVDYSAGKLTGTAIKAASWNGNPLTGAIRYIDEPDLLRTKHTDLTEYRSLLAAGLKVRLVMQNTTTDADGGYQAGVANAQRAKAGADYLGYSGVIFFTNDRTTVPDAGVWQAYLDGAASVLGIKRVGAYGFANALNLAIGHASAFWQSGRESDLVPHANYYQWNNGSTTVAGIPCDVNKVIRDYVPDADWMDMATKEEVQAAVHDGVLDALRDWGYYRYPDGRNLVDDQKQQTGSLIGLQSQVDKLIVAVEALKPTA
jgi:Domain of unknown function (DUF1906)